MQSYYKKKSNKEVKPPLKILWRVVMLFKQESQNAQSCFWFLPVKAFLSSSLHSECS